MANKFHMFLFVRYQNNESYDILHNIYLSSHATLKSNCIKFLVLLHNKISSICIKATLYLQGSGNNFKDIATPSLDRNRSKTEFFQLPGF